MKLCITSQGPELSSPVDPRFGRARYFLIYDEDTEAVEAIDNAQNVNAAGGAGIQSARTVVERGADWVVSGHIGPKALSVLKAGEVKVAVGADGTVQDAIAAFRQGELERADEADVPPRW
ncbi:MAG: NifB/NifX family molybdenum-iron cluster-binding protein [Candidatus Brocadiaceae bacterium]